MVPLIDMHVYLAQNTMMTHVALVCEPKASSCRLSLGGAANMRYGHGSLAIKHAVRQVKWPKTGSCKVCPS